MTTTATTKATAIDSYKQERAIVERPISHLFLAPSQLNVNYPTIIPGLTTVRYRDTLEYAPIRMITAPIQNGQDVASLINNKMPIFLDTAPKIELNLPPYEDGCDLQAFNTFKKKLRHREEVIKDYQTWKLPTPITISKNVMIAVHNILILLYVFLNTANLFTVDAITRNLASKDSKFSNLIVFILSMTWSALRGRIKQPMTNKHIHYLMITLLEDVNHAARNNNNNNNNNKKNKNQNNDDDSNDHDNISDFDNNDDNIQTMASRLSKNRFVIWMITQIRTRMLDIFATGKDKKSLPLLHDLLLQKIFPDPTTSQYEVKLFGLRSGSYRKTWAGLYRSHGVYPYPLDSIMIAQMGLKRIRNEKSKRVRAKNGSASAATCVGMLYFFQTKAGIDTSTFLPEIVHEFWESVLTSEPLTILDAIAQNITIDDIASDIEAYLQSLASYKDVGKKSGSVKIPPPNAANATLITEYESSIKSRLPLSSNNNNSNTKQEDSKSVCGNSKLKSPYTPLLFSRAVRYLLYVFGPCHLKHKRIEDIDNDEEDDYNKRQQQSLLLPPPTTTTNNLQKKEKSTNVNCGPLYREEVRRTLYRIDKLYEAALRSSSSSPSPPWITILGEIKNCLYEIRYGPIFKNPRALYSVSVIIWPMSEKTAEFFFYCPEGYSNAIPMKALSSYYRLDRLDQISSLSNKLAVTDLCKVIYTETSSDLKERISAISSFNQLTEISKILLFLQYMCFCNIIKKQNLALAHSYALVKHLDFASPDNFLHYLILGYKGLVRIVSQLSEEFMRSGVMNFDLGFVGLLSLCISSGELDFNGLLEQLASKGSIADDNFFKKEKCSKNHISLFKNWEIPLVLWLKYELGFLETGLEQERRLFQLRIVEIVPRITISTRKRKLHQVVNYDNLIENKKSKKKQQGDELEEKKDDVSWTDSTIMTERSNAYVAYLTPTSSELLFYEKGTQYINDMMVETKVKDPESIIRALNRYYYVELGVNDKGLRYRLLLQTMNFALPLFPAENLARLSSEISGDIGLAFAYFQSVIEVKPQQRQQPQPQPLIANKPPPQTSILFSGKKNVNLPPQQQQQSSTMALD